MFKKGDPITIKKEVPLSPQGSRSIPERGRMAARDVLGLPPKPFDESGGKPRIFWGMEHVDLDQKGAHFQIIGSTGSGKTTVLRLLMQSILPWIGRSKNPAIRALVYDAKNDMASVIHGILEQEKRDCPVYILNPFDTRAAAWNIAEDVTAPSHAQAVASILIPEEPNATQRFFTDASRSLLATVMTALALSARKRKKNNWTLRDVILIMRRRELIETVVASHESTYDKAAPYLIDEKTFPGILSTIATKLDPLEVVAALWKTCDLKFSLKEWLNPDSPVSESIVILGTAPAYRASIDPINQLIFRRLSDLLLHKQDTDRESTWLFLDEVREAGKLDGLPSLLIRGRSKGVTVVLGFQEIEGMEHVYGDKVASEICGQCAYKTFLKTNSHKTAEWIQSHFGQVEQLEYESNSNYSNSGASFGERLGRQVRHHTLASMLMMLPRLTKKNGLTAIHDHDDRGVSKSFQTAAELDAILVPRSKKPHCANELLKVDVLEMVSVFKERDFRRLRLFKPVENVVNTVNSLVEKQRREKESQDE